MGEQGSGLVDDVDAHRGQQIAEHKPKSTADGRASRIGLQRAVSTRLATAQVGIVDEVVVHQCGGLEHLKRAGDVEHGVARIGMAVERIVGGEHQQRAQSFATFAAGCRLP